MGPNSSCNCAREDQENQLFTLTLNREKKLSDNVKLSE